MRTAGHKICAAYALVISCLSQPAIAQKDEGTFNLVLENDIFAKSDRHYTSGLLLSYASDPLFTSNEIRQRAARLPGIGDRDSVYTSVHLGHQIFTPEDIETNQLQVDERPYAAYLFGGMSVLAANADELSAWTLNFGLVGPNAQGKQLQASIHNRTGSTATGGWEYQLGNEAILQLDYEQVWQYGWRSEAGRLGMDAMPWLGFGLGNAAVHLDGGITFRMGEGLDSDLGPFRLRPSMPGSNLFHSQNVWGWYLFLGLGVRHVAHNIFLDGNSNQPSHSVDKYSWVGDLQSGLVLSAGAYRLAFTFVVRSPEYETQNSADRFGSLTFSMNL